MGWRSIVSVILVLVLGFAAFVGFQWYRWSGFVAGLRPDGSFAETTPPPAPDYADAGAWAVTPSEPGKSRLVPQTPEASPPRFVVEDVDVFFIHPTTYYGGDYWNAPYDEPRASEGVDELVIPSQASIFAGCCRVFAPRYRQSGLHAFLAPSKDGRSALDLAYEDVKRAFQHYLEAESNGRPFIIASHSQGTAHALRLVEDMIDGTDLGARMVAAYLIGFRVPEAKLGVTLNTVAPCERAGDTGCFVAWDTYGENGGPNRVVDTTEHWYPTADGTGQWLALGESLPVCVNPISWTRDGGRTPADQHQGAVSIDLEGLDEGENLFGADEPLGLNTVALSPPYRGTLEAQCKDDGYLYVSETVPASFDQGTLPGRNLHNHDYGLFHMDIRSNLRQRIRAYLGDDLAALSHDR